MNRFVFSNPKLCIGCDTCLAACMSTHMAAGMPPQPRLFVARSGKASTPITCRHCDNAPCISACPLNAIAMGKNGVELNEAKCDGCRRCEPACPFGVITFSNFGISGWCSQAQPAGEGNIAAALVEDKCVAVKCDLCDFSAQGPECVRVCPTKALFLLDAKTLRKDGNAKRKVAAQAVLPFMSRQMK